MHDDERESYGEKRRLTVSSSSNSYRGALLTLFITMLLAVPMVAVADSSHQFAPPVYDIDSAPDGSILVAENKTIKEIRKGSVGEVVEIDSITPINGLAAIGRGNFFATSAGLDEGVGARLWRGSRGGARAVADIESFEAENDPDVSVWKDPLCEEVAQFTLGPQTNPYHLAAVSGSTALVADAAGNTLLSAKTNGDLDWVAVLTPPVDEDGDWLVLFDGEFEGEDVTCYVQPVPTAVDIGPDGAYYVSELTGATPEGVDIPGLARVWRIESDARHAVCPSPDCQVVIDGLTSVIDLVFGPDGSLYALEYDANGWLAAGSGNAAGGRIKKCDVEAGTCETVVEDLVLPGAITFDKWSNLWVVESNILAPTVHRVELS